MAEREAPWPESAPRGLQPVVADERGGAAYARLHRAHRLLQDRLAGAALPDDVSDDVAARLEALATLLGDHQVREHHRRDGFRIDLPGRGHPLLPAYTIDGEGDGRIHGRVTFTRFFLGGNDVAHGGSAPLLFDDVLGRVANLDMGTVARTAYLKVDFRAVVPLDAELRFEGSRDRVEGRKRFTTGRILAGDGTVLTHADALFVELRPGQP